eukprot:3933014-Amphidinium_carterae.1
MFVLGQSGHLLTILVTLLSDCGNHCATSVLVDSSGRNDTRKLLVRSTLQQETLLQTMASNKRLEPSECCCESKNADKNVVRFHYGGG